MPNTRSVEAVTLLDEQTEMLHDEVHDMPRIQRDQGDAWESHDPSSASDSTQETGTPEGPFMDLEPGWRAVRSLMQLRSDTLLSVMLRPSFRPVRDLDLVQVAPCPYCLDGGMRTAGSVRVRKGRVTVRACDTCATVDIGEQPVEDPRAS